MINKILICLLCCFSFSIHANAHSECNEKTHRLFKHELVLGGSVCLPRKIKRVVALDIGAAEVSMLTGREIIGAANWLLREMRAYYPNRIEQYAKAENVGIPANLEAIIKLKPDVILTVGKSEYTHKLIDIKQARKIAPVIAVDSAVYQDWKKSMQFWSKALGEETLYDEMTKHYQARITELKGKLQEKWGIQADKVDEAISQKKISVASITSHGMYMWLPLTPPSAILRDIGFSRPASQDLSPKEAVEKYKNDSYAKIGKEYLSLFDGDILFAFAYASHDPKVLEKEKKVWEKLTSSKLWQRLNVARKNQAYYVSNAWFRSSTYLLANRVLDDISVSMAGKKLTHSPNIATQ